MVHIRHTGIYVVDLNKEENFYKNAFGMIPICSNEPDENGILNELLDYPKAQIATSKLITPFGKEVGQGDMVELVAVLQPDRKREENRTEIYLPGRAHLAFGVDCIEETIKCIENAGGKQQTQALTRESGNKMCFCTDPEGNWIELIQRKTDG